MKIAITGSTGLVGQAVAAYFQRSGARVIRLIRPVTKAPSHQDIMTWDYHKQVIDLEGLEGLDVVIHLAGANIAGHRWTDAYKETIRASRVESTRFLAGSLSKLRQPPKVFLCASAVGFYGDSGPEKEITEYTSKGKGFLADVCQEWESAASPLTEKNGVRVVFTRFGTILSPKGGALAKMLPVFKLGLGGPIGDGSQIMSWIALDEIPRAMDFMIKNPLIRGPVNLTAPAPVSNKEFTKALGRALRRPVILPLPAAAVKLIFGEMGETLLLGGAKVIPQKLNAQGYSFQYPNIDTALRN